MIKMIKMEKSDLVLCSYVSDPLTREQKRRSPAKRLLVHDCVLLEVDPAKDERIAPRQRHRRGGLPSNKAGGARMIQAMKDTLQRALEKMAYPPMFVDGTGRVTRACPVVWPAYLLSATAIAVALYVLWR